MSSEQLRKLLVTAFNDTARMHHAAFESTDGVDPDWPIWYADHLQKTLSEQLDTEFGRAQLIYCLMNADFEHVARTPDADWASSYADQFIERYVSSPSPSVDQLALYWFPTCPFSKRVVKVLDRLGVDYELRDIHSHSEHMEDLVAARGRPTVPVLRISNEAGKDRWMPESTDIIQYLEATYGGT